ncbi:MAG: phosphoribosylformylglycinamidine cyclo-ligase [Patescibacteria group bacterium]|nr:phosphoribosylformylglycinamidine cyclo-ligase [Patescibacteria group bacterium]MDE2438714.1 phosphoribosylformylglycinamidine cyclo-ligase [Patescibacteria group bacterium]
MSMTYAGTGVNYNAMDPFKRMAQLAARETAGNIARLNGGEFREFEPSRGESAYLIEAAKSYFAHVEEGLGTKNLVADAMYALTGKSYYDHIAQCTVAMIVNDLVTLGALPMSVAMHLAVGVSDWFNDDNRTRDLVNGWKKACDLARCTWGGGETPTLKGVVVPEAIVLSGSAIGIVKPKERLIIGKIQAGDVIVIIESSGIHANGLTLARKIADKLPEGYLTKLSDGRSYGETLLDPTHIYVGLVEDCLNAGVDIHYAVNVTGHGWRKLMRSTQAWSYIIETLPKQLPIFDFLQEQGPVDDTEAYGNLNMGAGFALYVSEADVAKVLDVAHSLGLGALAAGHIEAGDKKVVIKPKSLEYAGETLAVR